MKLEQTKAGGEPALKKSPSRLRELTTELQKLEARLRLGGGPDKIERQHAQGKLTARERIDLLLDKNSYAQEIGLLVAYDQYKEQGVKGKGEGGNYQEITGRRQTAERKKKKSEPHQARGLLPLSGVLSIAKS